MKRTPLAAMTLCALALGVPGHVRPACAADEIHWTIEGQTAVTFEWRGSETTIAYGATPAHGFTVTATPSTPWPSSSPGPFWTARITGLQENTLYHYAIGGGPDHTFHTPPPHGSSGFNVLVEGDVGDAVTFPRMGLVQNLIAQANPQFVLVVGDITYANDFGQQCVDQHFNDVMAWSQDVAYMPAWGNHEWDLTTDDLRNYKGRFELPNAQSSPGAPDSADAVGTPRPYGKDWYWFDYGNTRFINIPDPYKYNPPSPWRDWKARVVPIMDEAEADSEITFIVTFGHRPSYTSGHYYPGSTELRGYLEALSATHSKYVLDLCGHAHDYERTYPQAHITHLVCGVGGANLEGTDSVACLWNSGCPPPAWSAYRAFRHATVQLRFTSTAIEGRVVCAPDTNTHSEMIDLECEVGTVIDTFAIAAPPRPVPTSPLAFSRVAPNPSNAGFSLTYSLVGSDPATLELLDAGGRMIMRQGLAAAGLGPHVAQVPYSSFPAPGIYFVRLRQSGQSAIAKVTVTPLHR